MLIVVIAVPVLVADAVLLAFFVPFGGPAPGLPGTPWVILFQEACFLLAFTTMFVWHRPPVRRMTVWLTFLACLLPHPLLWLWLAQGWDRHLVLSLAAIAVQFAFFGAAGIYQFMHRPRKGRCVQCDYDLTGNVSGRCPECGTPIPGAPVKTTWSQPEDPAKR